MRTLAARIRGAGFDPADVGVVDPGGSTQLRDRDVRIEAEGVEVLAGLHPESAKAALGFASDLGSRRWHS
jgi:hypothetical protein